MPSLSKNFLLELKDNYTNYNNFIESGTYLGKTINCMEPYFNSLYTIEIKEEFYNNCKKQYGGNKINFLLGDSTIVMETLLPTIKDKTIFFLDGHWSAGNTGKGKNDCPLYEELTLINTLYKNKGIIIIDDCRLFGKGPSFNNEVCNWEDINKKKIISIMKTRTTSIYYLDSECGKDDRMIIHIMSVLI